MLLRRYFRLALLKIKNQSSLHSLLNIHKHLVRNFQQNPLRKLFKYQLRMLRHPLADLKKELPVVALA